MPLLSESQTVVPTENSDHVSDPDSFKQQLSSPSETAFVNDNSHCPLSPIMDTTVYDRHHGHTPNGLMPPPRFPHQNHHRDYKVASRQVSFKGSLGTALTDTPASSAPSSPKIHPLRPKSSSSRLKATTLDIPGLTKSRVSPDGRISQRDVGSKLVVVMVGLPARGKSYITKKMARYLNWLQHDTRIFNVGERRRVAAGGPARSFPHLNVRPEDAIRSSSISVDTSYDIRDHKNSFDAAAKAATILVNGEPPVSSPEEAPNSAQNETSFHDAKYPEQNGNSENRALESPSEQRSSAEQMDQSASFFDPTNVRAAQLREQVALATLDELLDYVLNQGGSVGILDATNSTLERRQHIMKHIRERAGPDLGVLFVESLCLDENLLEANMRLKLSGPDYKDKDPVTALADFKKRVDLYQKRYVPLGEYEERNGMAYCQMVDVGRKVISHQIKGFLSAQAVYYLLNFNLAPRQIWITRHGESQDNVAGKIGGDSTLSPNGKKYAKTLTAFIEHERKIWEARQRSRALSTHFPPRPGDSSPPNPAYTSTLGSDNDQSPKAFCVWTSMLKRSIETGQYFDEDEFELKQMKMLDELNAGIMEGLTYEEIKKRFPGDYQQRRIDKLHYRYPGPGGEGYLDVINRLRAVIVEVERMTDHVLLIGHRSVVRVLLAYFKGLQHEEIADLDVPLGMLYMLEPKPYGVDFKAYRYDNERDWFILDPDYKLSRSTSRSSN